MPDPDRDADETTFDGWFRQHLPPAFAKLDEPGEPLPPHLSDPQACLRRWLAYAPVGGGDAAFPSDTPEVKGRRPWYVGAAAVLLTLAAAALVAVYLGPWRDRPRPGAPVLADGERPGPGVTAPTVTAPTVARPPKEYVQADPKGWQVMCVTSAGEGPQLKLRGPDKYTVFSNDGFTHRTDAPARRRGGEVYAVNGDEVTPLYRLRADGRGRLVGEAKGWFTRVPGVEFFVVVLADDPEQLSDPDGKPRWLSQPDRDALQDLKIAGGPVDPAAAAIFRSALERLLPPGSFEFDAAGYRHLPDIRPAAKPTQEDLR